MNQGGRRKGTACVYLETWHADIEEFLELRNVQELTNFFERRASAYQVTVEGTVAFHDDF